MFILKNKFKLRAHSFQRRLRRMNAYEARYLTCPLDSETGLDMKRFRETVLDKERKADKYESKVAASWNSNIAIIMSALQSLEHPTKDGVDHLCLLLGDVQTCKTDIWNNAEIDKKKIIIDSCIKKGTIDKIVGTDAKQMMRHEKMKIIYNTAVNLLNDCQGDGARIIKACQAMLIVSYQCSPAVRQKRYDSTGQKQKKKKEAKETHQEISRKRIKLTNEHIDKGDIDDPKVKAKLDKLRSKDMQAYKKTESYQKNKRYSVDGVSHYERVQGAMTEFSESKPVRLGSILFSETEMNECKKKFEKYRAMVE